MDRSQGCLPDKSAMSIADACSKSDAGGEKDCMPGVCRRRGGGRRFSFVPVGLDPDPTSYQASGSPATLRSRKKLFIRCSCHKFHNSISCIFVVPKVILNAKMLTPIFKEIGLLCPYRRGVGVLPR